MFGPYFHTFVLSQVFGLFFILSAIIMLCRAKLYRNLITKMDIHNGAVIYPSFFALFLGIFLVIIHNIWIMGPIGLVTVICWLILIKSILWLGFPEKMHACSTKMAGGAGFYVWPIISIILGFYLLSLRYYFVYLVIPA